jgi:hypothetical protein
MPDIDSVKLVDACINCIRHEIIPLTSEGVSRGSKVRFHRHSTRWFAGPRRLGAYIHTYLFLHSLTFILGLWRRYLAERRSVEYAYTASAWWSYD